MKFTLEFPRVLVEKAAAKGGISYETAVKVLTEGAVVPSFERLSINTVTDDQIIALFERHCTCRPTDVTRTSHSHDCDTGYTDACREALAAPYGSQKWMIARAHIVEIFKGDGCR